MSGDSTTTQTTPAAGGRGSRFAAGVSNRGTDGEIEGLESGPARGTARQEAGQEGHGTQQAATSQRGGTDRATASDAARTWTIELPAGIPLLSLNQRLHFHERNRRSQVIKTAAWGMARQQRIPRLERAFIAVEYQPPDRRHRDADNPIVSAKAAIDGLVLAGCLEDDECPKYVVGVYATIGPIFPKGRLVLRVSEVPS